MHEEVKNPTKVNLLEVAKILQPVEQVSRPVRDSQDLPDSRDPTDTFSRSHKKMTAENVPQHNYFEPTSTFFSPATLQTTFFSARSLHDPT